MLRPVSDLMALNDVPLLVADSSGRETQINCLLREEALVKLFSQCYNHSKTKKDFLEINKTRKSSAPLSTRAVRCSANFKIKHRKG